MPNAVKCVASYQCNYECGQAIVFRGARSLVQLLSRSKTQKIPEKKKKKDSMTSRNTLTHPMHSCETAHVSPQILVI